MAYTRLSRFLSLILRHKPETVQLYLDKQGYASVELLIEHINAYSSFHIDKNILDTIVSTDSKKRYSYNEDKTKIRANQGHSISVDLGLQPQSAPSILYHGTGAKYLESILHEGLRPKQRTHVHLSANIETAITVGQRHGSPRILRVDTEQMQKDGYSFYLSENHVWLTDHVPPQYLTLLPMSDHHE